MRLLAAAVALVLTACGHVGGTGAGASACRIGEPMIETMLYMGLLRPGGSISRFEFRQFVETEVVPRWKEGFTILDGQGLWRSDQRGITEREPTRVLVHLHDGGAEASAQVEAIRAAYIKAFAQDAVLRTDRPTCASF